MLLNFNPRDLSKPKARHGRQDSADAKMDASAQMLSNMSQLQLDSTILPSGGATKDKVSQMATAGNLEEKLSHKESESESGSKTKLVDEVKEWSIASTPRLYVTHHQSSAELAVVEEEVTETPIMRG